MDFFAMSAGGQLESAARGLARVPIPPSPVCVAEQLDGAVKLRLCRDGSRQFRLHGRPLATRQTASQLSPQFLNVIVECNHRPLLLF